MQSTAEPSSDASPRQSYSWYSIAFVCVVVAANAYILFQAWQDKSFVAFGLAIIGGPVTNGVLTLTGLIVLPFLKKRQPEYSMFNHLVLTFGLPSAFILADFVVIFSMDLRGC